MPTVSEIVSGILNHKITLANWAKERWGNDKLAVSSLLRAGYAYAHRAYEQGADNAAQLTTVRNQLTELRNNQLSLTTIVDAVVAALPAPAEYDGPSIEDIVEVIPTPQEIAAAVTTPVIDPEQLAQLIVDNLGPQVAGQVWEHLKDRL